MYKKRKVTLMIVFVISWMFILASITIYGAQAVTLYYNNAQHPYNNTNIQVKVNGEQIQYDGMYPVILESRTLVPVREVMESSQIGATVEWIAANQEIIIKTDAIEIILYVDNKTALVNGKEVQLDVAPTLISEVTTTQTKSQAKTMVPLRFIIESMGYQVQWHPENQEISIIPTTSDGSVPTDSNDTSHTDNTITRNLTEVSLGESELGDVFYLKGDFTDAKTLRLTNPERLVFDFEHTKNVLGNQEVLDCNKQSVQNYRIAQFAESTTRLVLETVAMANYYINYNAATDQTEILLMQTTATTVPGTSSGATGDKVLIFNKVVNGPSTTTFTVTNKIVTKEAVLTLDGLNSNVTNATRSGMNPDSLLNANVAEVNGKTTISLKAIHIYEYSIQEDESYVYVIATRPQALYEHIVVVDAGHGGFQPGAGYNGLVEKNVNLAIMTYFKNDPNKNSEIHYYYTRTEDAALTLTERCEVANDLGAELFVCMHCNALDVAKYPSQKAISGLEILTTAAKTKSAAEVEFANTFLSIFKSDLSSYNVRGVKSNNDLVVLKNTLMPAVIIEYGYLTNDVDVANLKNQTMLAKLAEITWKAIEKWILE